MIFLFMANHCYNFHPIAPLTLGWARGLLRPTPKVFFSPKEKELGADTTTTTTTTTTTIQSTHRVCQRHEACYSLAHYIYRQSWQALLFRTERSAPASTQTRVSIYKKGSPLQAALTYHGP